MHAEPTSSSVAPSVVFSALATLFGFILWCLVDVLVVHVLPYPGFIHSFDWLFVAYPIAVFLASTYFLRDPDRGKAIIYAVGSTFLVSALLLTLIVTIGVQFHFLIGGEL